LWGDGEFETSGDLEEKSSFRRVLTGELEDARDIDLMVLSLVMPTLVEGELR
jgi:hypothetical protein